MIILFLPTAIALFSSRYILKDLSDKGPSYVRASEEKLHRFHQKYINKSMQNSSIYTVITKSFNITLECFHPFNDTLYQTCPKVAASLTRIAERIQNVVYIIRPITVQVTYSSFCVASGAVLGEVCPIPQQTLAYAAPSSFYQFSQSEALVYGMDSDYLYPISLVKQYTNYTGSQQYDIYVSFDSGWNWWFSEGLLGSVDAQWGRATNINGGFVSLHSSKVAYDIESVGVHEFLHGLGFISSWGLWIDSIHYLPSSIDYDKDSKVLGVAPSYIFDKWISDATNNVWMRTWSDLIRLGIETSIKNGTDTWLQHFIESSAGNISSSLFTDIFQAQGGVSVWYPQTSSNELQRVILHSPTPYQPGSSVSHLDEQSYLGSSEFLMLPVVNGYAGGMESRIPITRNGPIGAHVLGILQSIGYVIIQI